MKKKTKPWNNNTNEQKTNRLNEFIKTPRNFIRNTVHCEYDATSLKLILSTLQAIVTAPAVYISGRLVFNVKITGSIPGFYIMVLFSSLSVGSFALLLMGLGRDDKERNRTTEPTGCGST